MNAPQIGTRWVGRFVACIGLALAVGLTACGGGEPTADSSKAGTGRQAPSAAATASASVISLTKISETRVSRTVYDYVFKVTFQNGNLGQLGVVGNLTTVGTGTTILDGSSVAGDMAANAAVTPTDTITLRHDRAYAFDQGALKWNVTSVASAGSLDDANLAGVDFGADTDGILYGIAGVAFNPLVVLKTTGAVPDGQYNLTVTCAATTFAALQLDGKWRLTANAVDMIAGQTTNVCLRIVNSTAHKYVDLTIQVKAIAPVKSGSVTLAPQGAATYTTSDGYLVKFTGNTSGVPVTADVYETTWPDGTGVLTITYNTDISSAGIQVHLPDLNAPPLGNGIQAQAKRNAAFASSPPLNIDNYPAYPVDEGNLGYLWNSRRAWVNRDDGMRIPDRLFLTNGRVSDNSPDLGWLVARNAQGQFEVTVERRVASQIFSVLPPVLTQKLNDEDVVIFIHGFTLDRKSKTELGGGKGTWDEFPRLAKNASLFSGKQLIPFEFRWATNARFADVADDLAKSINLINGALYVNTSVGGTVAPRRIYLVAHSFGGLVVRTLMQGLATPSSSTDTSNAISMVKSAMTLGTPHSGIQNNNDFFLPKGIDKIPLENISILGNRYGCEQVTCYEAGVRTSLVNRQLALLYGRAAPGSGWLPKQLSGLFTPVPPSLMPDIDFFVGIGLRRDSNSSSAGDGLISFEGQRFSPDARQSVNLLNSVPTPLGGNVTEVVLGNPYRGAIVPPSLDYALPRQKGFAHTWQLARYLNLNSPSSTSDGNGWGLEANIAGGCQPNDPPPCSHPSQLLLWQMVVKAPTLVLLSPGTMIANNTPQPITLTGANFLSRSVVQMRSAIGGWVTVPNWVTEPNPDPGNSVSSTQITVMFNPGTATNVFGIRVCRGGYAITDADCSAEFGLTAPASPPAQVFRDDFNGTTLNGNYWTGVVGISGYSVANGTVQFNRASSAHTNGKIILGGGKIVVEARFGGLTSNGRDTNIALVDIASGDRVQAGDTNYQGQGFYAYATGAYGLGQQSTGSPSTNGYLEYRITLEDRTLTLERGPSLNNLNFKKVFTLAQSSIGKSYYLQIGTGGGIEYSPGTFDWVQITATTVNAQPAPPPNFPTTCNGQSTVMGGWTRFGTATYNTATNTYSVGDTIGFSDPNDADGDCNQVASWHPSGTNTQDNDFLVYNRSTTGDIDFSSEACIPHSPVSGHLVGLFVVDPAFTGLPRSGHNPYSGGVVHFSTQWNLPGRLYVGGTGVGPIFIPNAVMTAKGFCGTYRTTRVGNLYSAYFNNSLVISVVGTTAAIVPVVVAYDNVIEMKPTVIFPN